MQNRRQELGGQLCASEQRSVVRRATTYLAKVAVVLQDAPDKMLPFARIMDKMAPLVFEDRKSVENNIRVCLSSHKCFIKIPVDPNARESKKNYWKLDSSQITAKMVRRHFKGLLQVFPELACKLDPGTPSGGSAPPPAPPAPRAPRAPAACSGVQLRCEVKFSGPFSIESLLKRDEPSRGAPRAAPPRAAPLRPFQPRHGPAGAKTGFGWSCEEPLLVHTAAGSFPVWPAGGSRHRGAAPDPRLTSVHCSYITYLVPASTHDVLRF